jgi:phosphate-selective porin OprO/OprP
MSARHARRAFRPVVPLLVMIALIMMQKPCQGQTALFPSPIVPFDISADVPLPDASTQQGQSSSRPSPSPTPNPNATIENTSAAGDSPDEPRRKLVKWNEYEGPYITFRAGGGFLVEAGGFQQDAESKEQFKLKPDYRLRDFRFLLSGKFPSFERSITWCAGIMYDGPSHSWLVRQTGVQIAIPELWGAIFVGRTKEGFSMEKVIHGYDGWWMERSAMQDATVPLLADGIKWLGYTPKHGFLWNVGYYNDVLSKGQSFSSYASQVSGRFAWLPVVSEEKGELIHLGVNLRYGIPVDHTLQLKSRPEAFTAPNFIDTGKFAADSTHMEGYEVYFRKRSLLLGSEYWWENINSPSTGNPTVNGGFVMAAWTITGEVRPYNTVGGVFKDISPNKTVFEGGPGAWELVLRYSNADLDSEGIHGGVFKRVTPMMNWYLSDNVRWEFTYGYGRLNRFDLVGHTQFFQSRIQLQL